MQAIAAKGTLRDVAGDSSNVPAATLPDEHGPMQQSPVPLVQFELERSMRRR